MTEYWAKGKAYVNRLRPGQAVKPARNWPSLWTSDHGDQMPDFLRAQLIRYRYYQDNLFSLFDLYRLPCRPQIQRLPVNDFLPI
jgi:hypothetical protein